SNNNATPQKNAEIDIRDIVGYLIGKLWIIALVILCFAIIAFLWTTFFITKEYTSTTDLFIINTSPNQNNNTNSPSATDWSIGKQLTKTSSELIMGDYCDRVAELLKNHDPSKPVAEGEVDLSKILNNGSIMPEGSTFSNFFKSILPENGITGSYIRSCIKVTSDDETCIVSVTATTKNNRLSAAISNAVMALFGDYINEFMKVDTIVTTISSSGSVPSSASNANATRNAIIFGAIGAVLVCAVLVIIFIFDDKIKTPDDIEKQLGLSVLGAIPEIDEE
ncbi:MAG: hypothetical protein IJ039_02675, partial [Clostridia bacterium]|nr:hypothetical protein [Clostridia bacterium]